MNYHYKGIDQDLIVDEKEHEAIQKALDDGKTTMALRGGSIGLNMATAHWDPTYELTDEQEKQRSNTLRLDAPEPKRMSKEKMAKTHQETYAKMGWEHGENCRCKDKGIWPQVESLSQKMAMN